MRWINNDQFYFCSTITPYKNFSSNLNNIYKFRCEMYTFYFVKLLTRMVIKASRYTVYSYRAMWPNPLRKVSFLYGNM